MKLTPSELVQQKKRIALDFATPKKRKRLYEQLAHEAQRQGQGGRQCDPIAEEAEEGRKMDENKFVHDSEAAQQQKPSGQIKESPPPVVYSETDKRTIKYRPAGDESSDSSEQSLQLDDSFDIDDWGKDKIDFLEELDPRWTEFESRALNENHAVGNSSEEQWDAESSQSIAANCEPTSEQSIMTGSSFSLSSDEKPQPTSTKTPENKQADKQNKSENKETVTVRHANKPMDGKIENLMRQIATTTSAFRTETAETIATRIAKATDRLSEGEIIRLAKMAEICEKLIASKMLCNIQVALDSDDSGRLALMSSIIELKAMEARPT